MSNTHDFNNSDFDKQNEKFKSCCFQKHFYAQGAWDVFEEDALVDDCWVISFNNSPYYTYTLPLEMSKEEVQATIEHRYPFLKQFEWSERIRPEWRDMKDKSQRKLVNEPSNNTMYFIRLKTAQSI